MDIQVRIGTPLSRVDGIKKVTGSAKYAGEFATPGLLHGCIVAATITKGRIARIDTSDALAHPGVVEVITHENRLQTARRDGPYQDAIAPPGSPYRPLYDAEIKFAGQPVALVVAETPEAARFATTLVRVEYDVDEHNTDLAVALADAFEPWRKRDGFSKPASRGNATDAFGQAAVKIASEYHLAPEHHSPMEMFASTVVFEGEGKLTIYDKTQGAQNSQDYVCNVFSLSKSDVRVLSPFVGGAFGAGLRPQKQLYLATMAALMLKRSVRVVLSRQEMFGNSYRPECIMSVSLGCTSDGRLTAIRNDATTTTSRFENYMETVVNWGAIAYRCDHADLEYKIAPVDTYTPSDMRAPGAATGMTMFEIAMDELAYEAKIDPLELRLRNYSDIEEMQRKEYTSKALRACYEQGAERFGWSQRNHAPRSMREGRELVGWGMATGIWEALFMKTTARATLHADGRLEVGTASADIGTGTYTVMTQVAAEALGLPVGMIDAKLGDSSLPMSPVEGGSWGAASVGAAVQLACEAVREKILAAARNLDGSPFANASKEHVTFADSRISLNSDPSKAMTYREVMERTGIEMIEAEETAKPGLISSMTKARNTYSAVFAEVRVDEELGVIRVTRIVNAVAAGRIVNPKTARSQIMGGVVFAIGMALEEESMMDHRLGRFMNHSFAEYHLPVNADVRDIDVIFVSEPDAEVTPLGIKGVGEIGGVGTAAAIANAIFHATGKRIRSLPITIDKLL